MPRIEVQDLTENDIPMIMDYWFHPDNQDYHEKRGLDLHSEGAEILKQQPAILKKQIQIPVKDRKSTTAIIVLDGKKVGHVLLNNIQDEQSRRMHFHMWRHHLPKQNLGATTIILKQLIQESLKYFFQEFNLSNITGDISQSNKVALYVLSRAGFEPLTSVQASYLGQEGFYKRFTFRKEDLKTSEQAYVSRY